MTKALLWMPMSVRFNHKHKSKVRRMILMRSSISRRLMINLMIIESWKWYGQDILREIGEVASPKRSYFHRIHPRIKNIFKIAKHHERKKITIDTQIRCLTFKVRPLTQTWDLFRIIKESAICKLVQQYSLRMIMSD